MNPSSSPSPILESARAAYKAGLSVVPPKQDGSKAPVAEWKRYQSERASKDEMKAWYGPCLGLGAITGRVSGNLEVFDFDDRATYDAFVEVAAQSGLGALISRIETGYVEDTPKGGVHWLTRCDDVSGNLKLAKRQQGSTIKTLIETRGEGGYIVLAPSNGAIHETGLPYLLRAGGFATIQTLTSEERRDLIQLARSFDEMPSTEPPARRAQPTAVLSDTRPGDAYAARATWPDILEPHGWARVFDRGDVTHWRRPGKTCGTSATTNIHGSDLLYVFSGSTPFEAERGYGKFGAYALLCHGGDHRAAARELGAAGFGAPATSPQHDAGPGTDEQWPGPAVSLIEPLSDVLHRVLTDLESDELPKVCATPYPSLNYCLNGGFSPGELIYLGARPAVGKSSIGLDIARRASRVGPVLVISREMINVALARRMLSQEGKVNAATMKRKTLSDLELQRVALTATKLGGRPIWLSDQAVSVEQIESLCAHPPAGAWTLVIVDYLQLVRAPKDIKEHRLALEHVSQELKAMAIRYAVPVLCLSSLARPPQGNPEPSLASLRDSGELEHDADIVLLLHRTHDDDKTVQCRVAKNRDGALGSFNLLFLSDFVTFEELEEGAE